MFMAQCVTGGETSVNLSNWSGLETSTGLGKVGGGQDIRPLGFFPGQLEDLPYPWQTFPFFILLTHKVSDTGKKKITMKSFSLLALLASAVSAQQLCEQYGYHGQSGWYFNNNAWGSGSGSGSQCTYVDEVRSDGVSWHTDWQWSGSENNVKAYPYSGRELSNKPLVSSIGSIPSSASWGYSGNNVRANVAYDLFTAADAGHDTSSGDYELMIW